MAIPSLRVLTAVLIFSVSFGLVDGPVSKATEEQTDPIVQKIRGRTVTVSIPEGFQRIALQKLVSSRKGKAGRKGGAAAAPEWLTVATEFPNGKAGEFTFQLGKLVAKRNLRVIGNRGEALPDTLLTNVISFDPEPEGFTIDGSAPVSLGRIDALGSTVSVDGVSSVTGSLSIAGNASLEPREVVESDIWKVSGERLYFFNQMRGLQILDLQNPDDPALAGTLRMPGAGEQMYLLGDTHAVLLARKSWLWDYWSRPIVLLGDAPALGDTPGLFVADFSGTTTLSLSASTASVRSAVISILPIIRATNDNEVVVVKTTPGAPKVVARVPYKGNLRESRLVGSVLYLVTTTYETSPGSTQQVYGCKVASIDLSVPANPVERASIFYPGFGQIVTATDRFLFIAHQTAGAESLEVVDISSPVGAIAKRGSISITGTIDDKFKLHQEGDVLTVVTQETRVNPGQSPTWRNTFPITVVTNYSLGNPDAPTKLGSVELAPGETVRATRFDNGRAYVVTFVPQGDPLWVVDVASTGVPNVLGHVEVPGFSTYIEPLGDRLVTIGMVGGKPTVSLFDVSEPAAPKVLSQISVSDTGWTSSEATWNEKAFTVLPEENLILLPYSTYDKIYVSHETGVQLFELQRDKITKRGAIKRDISPRRTTVHRDRIVAVSERELISVDATNLDQPKVTAEVEISWPVNRVILEGDYLLQIENGDGYSTHGKLTISPAVNTDESLGDLDFGLKPVLAATVKDGILYVLQAPRYYGSYDGGVAVDVRTVQPKASLSCYDLSKLPSVSMLGVVELPTEIGDVSGDGQLLWLNATTLLWVQDGWQYCYRPIYRLQADSTNVEGWSTDIVPRHQKRLFALDVTAPSAPKLASRLQFGFSEPWDIGRVIVSNGSVYFSYKHLGKVVPFGQEVRRNSTLFKIDAATANLRNRHFLKVIDYGDPAAPFVRENSVNLPGPLQAISKSGQLLFTLGQRYTPEGTASDNGLAVALHVSAFDGTAAHLVDQLPLTSFQPFLVANDTIALLYPEPAMKWVPTADPNDASWNGAYQPNANLSRLETWAIRADGKLSQLDSVTIDHDTNLGAVKDLWVTYGSSDAVRLIDGTKPEELTELRSHTLEGSFYFNLGQADGDVHRGLWLPLDTYGVEPVLLTP